MGKTTAVVVPGKPATINKEHSAWGRKLDKWPTAIKPIKPPKVK